MTATDRICGSARLPSKNHTHIVFTGSPKDWNSARACFSRASTTAAAKALGVAGSSGPHVSPPRGPGLSAHAHKGIFVPDHLHRAGDTDALGQLVPVIPREVSRNQVCNLLPKWPPGVGSVFRYFWYLHKDSKRETTDACRFTVLHVVAWALSAERRGGIWMCIQGKSWFVKDGISKDQ